MINWIPSAARLRRSPPSDRHGDGVAASSQASFVTGVESRSVPESLESSDQVSFTEQNVPAVQIFTAAHADYHRPSDTAGKIDIVGLAKVAAFVKEGIAYLAERPEPLTNTIKPPPRLRGLRGPGGGGPQSVVRHGAGLRVPGPRREGDGPCAGFSGGEGGYPGRRLIAHQRAALGNPEFEPAPHAVARAVHGGAPPGPTTWWRSRWLSADRAASESHPKVGGH
jgi:hypothetical protein